MVRSFFRKMLLLAGLAIVGAAALPPAADAARALLTVTSNGGETVTRFDREALEKLPVTTFETTTPWTEGKIRFEGVKLSDLVAAVKAEGNEIVATALNDYAVTLPVVDETGADPIIAYKANGEPMSVREKGPLWIMYPFDSDEVLQTETYQSRAIWQLNRLTIR
ncbi:molybdopterin-dependent oxidoreductase [Jiella mangrovi]|uniref:Molybdopterin-dependent oxidoreductase n=1 Tax=Jiella mangrovi TaxID=2821407 RepID=A0ABS4BIX3_9HYPH|nr:molybdopterin-dependent oxidoreductase [Jiella mangrovi]MBP0616492.1 molybdopterin-dependent oxidoreductase [Jiella mangrovi]